MTLFNNALVTITAGLTGEHKACLLGVVSRTACWRSLVVPLTRVITSTWESRDPALLVLAEPPFSGPLAIQHEENWEALLHPRRPSVLRNRTSKRSSWLLRLGPGAPARQAGQIDSADASFLTYRDGGWPSYQHPVFY